MKIKMLLLIATVTIPLAHPAGAQDLDGKLLFAKNCAACHQIGGTGIEGAFPALKGNVFVQSDPALVVTTVLKGRAGMPTFATSLTDEKLAAILSYVRQAWGNHAAAITADEVTMVRLQSGAADALDGAPKSTPSH